jgi:hypothetical protein
VPVLGHVQNKYSVLGYLDIYLSVCLQMPACIKFVYTQITTVPVPLSELGPPHALSCKRVYPPNQRVWAHTPAVPASLHLYLNFSVLSADLFLI